MVRGETLSVSVLLQDAFERKKLSKNAVIRETNIDRSTFYQIIRGKRTATYDQFQRIVSKLDLSSEERLAFCAEYEREKAGDKVFASRAAVKQFFNDLSRGTGAESVPIKTCSAVSKLIKKVSESENPEIRFYMSAEAISELGIYRLLSEMAGHAGRQIHAELILVIRDAENSTDAILLHNLLSCLMALQADHLTLDLYTISSKGSETAGQPFPYYCMGCGTVVLVSTNGYVCRQLKDPDFYGDYQDSFAKAMKQTSPAIVRSLQSLQELMQEAIGYLQACEGKKVFLMAPHPCIWLSTTDEEVEKYLPSTDFLTYKHALASSDITEIGCRSGIEKFLHSSRIQESGIVIPLQKEDMGTLREHIQDRIGRNLFLVNEEAIGIPSDWIIFVFDRERVAFIPYDKSDLMVTACNKRITGLFYDWFQSRVHTFNADLLDTEDEGARA